MLMGLGHVGRQMIAAKRRLYIEPAALDLSFMTPGTLDPSITFTRASTATYFDVTGTMQTAVSGAPRWDYDPVTHALRGLLIEDARVNVLLNSATLGTQSVSVSAQAYTLSFYGTGTITLSGAASGSLVGTGAFPTRVSLGFTPTAGSLTLTVIGTVQNAQLEASGAFSFPSSYIPTTAAAATRATDAATTPTSLWINQLASTLQTEVIVPYTTGFAYVSAELDDGTTNNMLGLRLIAPSVVSAFSFIASALAGNANAATFVANTIIKAAVAADNQTHACACSVNSAAASAFTLSGTLPTLTRLVIGSGRTLSVNGWMRRVRYWPRVLSSAELQLITT